MTKVAGASPRSALLGLVAVAVLGAGGFFSLTACAVPGGEKQKQPPEIPLVEKPAFPFERHLESKDIAAGKYTHAQLFEAGDKLFHAAYNGLDGVGMLRTVGGKPLHRFSTGPAGGGQPIPLAAQSCGSCHAVPFNAGAGLVHTRVIFDPDQNGEPPFSPRDTISLFGDGVLQLLAQEMTVELLAAREAAAAEAKKTPGVAVKRALVAKGVEFGSLAATAASSGEVKFDLSGVRGVSPDLVVRPMGWKGSVVTVRNLVVAASNFGMGMMSEEFVWRLPPDAQPDPDGDGVARELSVGDITALTVYNAAQEAPAELDRLAALGLVAPPDPAARARVERGRALFTQAGCASCHVPELRLAKTVFEEPTLDGGGRYLDGFLAGKDPAYDPARPARFDVLTDSQAPRIESHPAGGAVVRLYGDLKRHDMGRTLAEPGGPVAPFDVTLTPLQIDGQLALVDASEFLTPELWGVADTGPYLHDDRAGTLAEAIAMHGEDQPPAPGQPGRSEAQESRDAYRRLTADEQGAIVTFLKSLVTFSAERR